MKSYVLGFLAALVVVLATPVGCLLLGFAPIHSDARPSALETALMRFAVRASVHRHAVELPPAPVANEQAVIAGGKLYVQGCAGCHGELGKPFQEDRANFPPVPQFTTTGTPYTQSEVAWVIKHGVRMTAMSAYGRFYTEDQIWNLAAFVKESSHLSKSLRDLILAKPQ
jgi:mono/diheme cytochrome c family protein